MILVAPYGAPIDVTAWDRFADGTGLGVVIDAAAAFDSIRPGRTPIAVSLHATKVLGVGEGGLLASKDEGFISNVRCLANFGFNGRRTALSPAFNAKMSEYTAAIGLAGLDRWPETRAAFGARRDTYATELSTIAELALSPGFRGDDWVSSTCVVAVPAAMRHTVEYSLGQRGIETRQWWGEGCHRQPAFAACPRRNLTVTERLAGRTIGLPFHLDLGPSDIALVADALAAVLSRHSGSEDLLLTEHFAA